MPTMYAQDITDAVRYSSDNVEGTARFKAMSGAFGALGGDISAMSVNPAGSAIFSYSHTSLSISSYNSDNETNYFNSVNTNSNSDFAFNQAGAAFVFNSRNNSPWRKFVLGFAYDQTQNFDDDFFASGTSTTSIDSYFLANAQGLRLDEIIALPGESIDDAYSDLGATFGYRNQQAFLGYEAYILEPDTDDAATGYNGKFGINLAAQYEDNLYLGLNLNSHFINYDRSTFLFEENSNAGSLVTEVDFENNLSTIGNGFSFQLGGIAKLSNDVRVGLTYDSPTWYTITEETSQYVASVRDDGGPTTAIVDPQVINIYPDYKLQTPAKITGSIALVFNQQGLISFDYSRKDYGSTKFKPESDSYFASQNTDISNSLKVANTYRIGGELRQDNFSFRGGYKLEQSPYNDTSFYGDLKGYSLGIGYNFGGTRLDLAYENSKRDINYQLYNVGLTNAARISRENSNFTLSLSMNL